MRHRNTNIFRLLFATLFLLFPLIGLSQQYHITSYSVEDGLGQSQVTTIIQDSDGYLWIGTYGGGASKFDGRQFENYSTKEGLVNNVVHAIVEDRQGTLWFGSEAGVCKFDGAEFNHLTESVVLNRVPVLAIFEDRVGALWFGTEDGGLVKYDGNQFSEFTTKDGLNSDTIRIITQDNNGSLWFGTADGVNKTDGRTFSTFHDEVLSGKTISAILEDNRGNFWFGTETQGVIKFDGTTFAKLTTQHGLSHNTVHSILEDTHGNVWFATDNGVDKFDGKNFVSLSTTEGLSNNIIRTMLEDREGNLWLGTWGGGINKYVGGKFVLFGKADGLNGELVMCIYEDAKGQFWFGTYGGGISKYNGSSFTYLTTETGLVNDVVYDITQDGNGVYWIATEGGITRIEGDEMTNFTIEDGLAHNTVNAILQDRRGELWFATWGGGVSQFDGSTFRNYRKEDGLLDLDVFSIIEDREGNLWCGTWGGGLGKLVLNGADADDRKFVDATPIEQLKNVAIISVLKDKNHNLWLGTYGAGVVKFNPFQRDSSTAVETFTTNDGLSDDAVVFLSFDDRQNLWIGTNKGLNKLDVAEYEKSGRKIIKQYGPEEGFVGIECNQNAAFKDSNGHLWFGNIKGVTRYNPVADTPNLVEPVTHITNLRLFFEEPDWQSELQIEYTAGKLPSELRLPHDKNHVTFDYIGLNYTNPEKVTYQFMLESFDEKWTPVTKETSATYSNLPPGEYSFKVKAANNDGVWNSEPTTYQFVISPPFWKSWWFYLLTVVTCSGALYSIVKFRTRQIDRQRYYLEKQVEERTKALRTEKEKTERVNEELEKLSLVASETDNGVLIADRWGNIEWLNEGFTRMTGFTLEELIQQKGRNIRQISANPEISKTIDRCIATGRSVIYESVNLTKDERERTISSTLTPILDDHGQVRKLVVIDSDITARKQAELEVKIQKAYFEQLFEHAPEAIVLLDTEDRVIRVNEEFTRLFGYSQYQVSGKTVNELIVPEGRYEEARSLSNRVTNNQRINVETKRQRKDGTLVDVSILGTPVVLDGGQVAIFGIYRDITQRKRAEAELRQSEEKYSNLFQRSNDGIIIHDLQGNILDANPKALELFDISKAEFLTNKIQDLHPNSERFEVEQRLAQVEWDGFVRFEIEFMKKDGQLFPAEVSASMFEISGKPVVQGIVRDISERKRAENALKQAKELAEHSNRAKSEFLANMSHEIRTPLNAIIGMTELALDTDLSPEQLEYLKILQSSSEGLLSLINDILDFSKIEASEMELEQVPLDFREVIEGVTDILSVPAAEKNLEMLCYFDPSLSPWVIGDPTRLRQILLNLVGNAIKFTEQGEVSVKVVPAKKEGTAQKRDGGSSFHVMISDTGIGISRKQQAKIFQKFSQADTSTTREFGGTGLGLSISKSLVDLMGGRIWVESKSGKGTTFHITLDLPIAQTKIEEEKQYDYPDFQDIAVLVVDDNGTNRFILRKTLRAWGFQVQEAESGSRALKILQNPDNDFGLVVLDQQMPNTDGVKVVQAIRQEPKLENTKIILLCSFNSSHRQLQKKWHVDYCITKPVKQSRLLDALMKVLRRDRKEPERAFRRTSSIAPGQISRRTCILVVEDNLDNQKLAQRMLEKAGYEVSAAENGKAAFEAVKDFHYDLILMDVQMPVMDGFAATKKIRDLEKQTREPRMPIIALTAHALKGYREKCLEHEMDDYLTKPLRKKALLNTVQKWIDPRPKILVVDDSMDNRAVLTNHLKKEKIFKLITAENGREALEIYRRHAISMVLMDMEMPVMSGYDAARKIKSLEDSQDIPIIALTAHLEKAEVEKCLQAGCSDYLPKPIRKGKLHEILESHFGSFEEIEQP